MSLPKYLSLLVLAPALVLVLAGILIRLHRAGEQLRRIEAATGVWRVQEPSPVLRVPRLTDDEYAALVTRWALEHGSGAA